MRANDNQPVPNEMLREFATGHAFVMTLAKTHVANLDALAHGDLDRAAHRMRRLFVPAVHQLIARGLVEWRYNPDFNGNMRGAGGPITNNYRLTRAGWLMHDLLAEAGLVEAVKARKLRSLVA